MNATIEKTKRMIEQKRILKLSQSDAILLAKALDSPKTHLRLQQAANRYQEITVADVRSNLSIN